MKTLFVWFNFDGHIKVIEKNILQAFDELNIEYQTCYVEEYPKVVKEYNPIITVFFHPNKLIYNIKEDIKNQGGHKLLWDMESPYESDIVFDMADSIYYIFTSDRKTAELLKKEKPGNQVYYVPHACNPKVHKRLDDVPYKYKSDILLLGNAYPSRIKYLQDNAEQFKRKILTVVGVGYWGIPNADNQNFVQDIVPEEECIKYYNGAKTVLNLHRTNSDLDMANSRNIEPQHLNNRFYELAAMGISQVVENRDDMKDEMDKVLSMKPDQYSYTSRLKEFFVPLLEGIGK